MGNNPSSVITAISSALPLVMALFGKPPKEAPEQFERPPPTVTKKSKEELIAEAQKTLGLDVRYNYNFAVVGQSGAGKSSLVNAFRGLHDYDREAARVGEAETTCRVTPYPHPEHPHIVIWDLPGAGTVAHPSETYFEDKMLYAFDCLIIVTGDRFTQIDMAIAKKASTWGVPLFFVRGKADQALLAKARRSPPGSDIKLLLRQDISNAVIPQLQQAGLTDRKLYVISSWAILDNSIPQMDEYVFICDVVNTALNRRRQLR